MGNAIRHQICTADLFEIVLNITLKDMNLENSCSLYREKFYPLLYHCRLWGPAGDQLDINSS
jgi:hypothetical protein